MQLQQKGFTLVELIVVIVILGILAATALPRFVNIQNEARVASVGGIAGGLRSAVAVIQAKWMAAGASGSNVTTADNQSVQVVTNGLPSSDITGIGRAMQCETSPCGGMTITFASAAGTATFQPTNGGGASCKADYDASTGSVTTVTGGC